MIFLKIVCFLFFQLFSDVFVEDPLFLCEIAERKVSEEESNEQTRVSAKENNKRMMKNVARLMEVIGWTHLCIVSLFGT